MKIKALTTQKDAVILTHAERQELHEALKMVLSKQKQNTVDDTYRTLFNLYDLLTRDSAPSWARYVAVCCGRAYSSGPFTYNDGCGRGDIKGQLMEEDR